MPSPSDHQPSNLTGKLLLANPSIQDKLFKKSVILISKHQRISGASGLILNHPTAQTVGDLLQTDKFAALKNLRVYLGGPVNQQQLIFAEFWIKEHSNLRYATQISAQEAIDSTHKPGTVVRAFAGHSSWIADQLEEEIEGDSWITAEADPEILGKRHERSLWADILRTMSPYHQILAEAPDDIFVN